MLKCNEAMTLERVSVPAMLPLTARGLTFAAGQRRLVDDVSLTLDGTARTVVMGPNGAGKSLLLRLLHGLVAPTAGEVLWAGRPADREIRARQAMVFQRPLLLRRSAEANIRYVLGNLDAAERRDRALGILARAGLERTAATPARLLSGGEQQRLAIARALALEPAILFLDEPCANLDTASTRAVEDMIEQAHGDGTKIVLVTHDIGQARRLADEIVFLHHGRLCELTPARRFFAHPASEPARAYLDGRIPE
jgi:tungstate transport system ATP-binding protein